MRDDISKTRRAAILAGMMVECQRYISGEFLDTLMTQCRKVLDPYDAKEQARSYAEYLNAPLVILSNGREFWFWNFERADQRDAYRIERLPSRTFRVAGQKC